MLSRYTTAAPRSHRVRYQVDQRIGAQVLRARILWLQGFPDQAMRTAQDTVEDAQALGHLTSLGYALAAGACPVAFLAGDLAKAEALAAMLLRLSARHGLALWHDWSRNFGRAIAIRRGDVKGELQRLRAELDENRGTRPIQFHQPFLAELAQGFGRAGDVAAGLAAIHEALDASERAEERWYVAELLRIKGDLLLVGGGRAAVAAAEHLFAESLDWARRQAALSWQLRTSISMTRLWRGQRRGDAARELLASLYRRFTEGFETADLLAAKQLLDDRT
jgi:predicted ATPase